MDDIPTNPVAMLDRMATDPAFYRSRLKIEASGQLVRYADVCDPWQEADFRAMDRAWQRCVGQTTDDVTPMRSWLERPRGASKTSDLAHSTCWALRFSRRRIRLIWCAGDTDQARLGIKAIEQANELNPWLALTVQRNVVRYEPTGSELEVLSSDAATGFGQLVDGIAVDEINNWPDTESAQRFWQMVASTISKKLNCVCLGISNAGRLDSWQWEIREKIRDDPNWYFHALDKPPSWITEAQLAEQRRLLPNHAYLRLWENRWTSGTDSGLSPADVEACVTLPGPQPGRSGRYDLYLAAVDLGWRHDRTAIICLAANIELREVALVATASWHPMDHGGEVDFAIVEYQIEQLHNRFQFDRILFDPREATGISQRLTNKGLPCFRASLCPEMQNDMAKYLFQVFTQRTVRLYRDAELIRDLLSLSVVDRTVGLKLQAARTSGGHSDKAFSFAICNYMAQEMIQGYRQQVPEEILIA